MHTMKIERTVFTDKTTIGKFYLDDVFMCHVLEDFDRELENGGEKVYGKTCIPRGEYIVVLSKSKRFGRITPEILNVPGFTGIRMHRGNYAADTEGCPLFGEYTEGVEDFVMNSRIMESKVMTELLEKQNAKYRLTIT